MRIGVLALQGDYEAHGRALARLGVETVYVRLARELEPLEGLILPGGESTTMLKLLEEENLFEPLAEFAAKRPLLGTCAGAILMAREVTCPRQRSMGLIDMAVERNAYGRQVDSSIRLIEPSPQFLQRAGPGEFEAVFIRAPIIHSVGPAVTVLASEQDHPVLVEQGLHLAATFHPELSEDCRIHRLLAEKIRCNKERVA